MAVFVFQETSAVVEVAYPNGLLPLVVLTTGDVILHEVPCVAPLYTAAIVHDLVTVVAVDALPFESVC